MDSNFFFNLLWPRTISICYDEDVGFGSTFFFLLVHVSMLLCRFSTD
jgi:hypothetical protein